MRIENEWRRIAGIQYQSDGAFAAVWIAHDPVTDVCHLYDVALMRREIPVVIAQCMEARGRWIPVSWPDTTKAIHDELLNRGVTMVAEPVKEGELSLEMAATSVEERMRSSRLRVDKRLGTWLDEVRTFRRTNGRLPKEGYPIMMATQHAIARLTYARRQAPRRVKHGNYPKVAIL